MKENKHNRRNFIRVSAGIILTGFVVLWDRMISSDKKLSSVKRITIPFDFNRNYTFHQDFIIIKGEDEVKVFSSRCTHLGCTIHSSVNDKLVCPCHGSTFNLDGNPDRGPAMEPLKQLQYKLDADSQQITIEL